MNILDLDIKWKSALFRMLVKGGLLKETLQGDTDNAEEQVFEEWVFLEERRNQTTERNKAIQSGKQKGYKMSISWRLRRLEIDNNI